MKKLCIVLVLIVVLTGCETCYYEVKDKELWNKKFIECLEASPKPSQATHYSDLDEVVEACNKAVERQLTVWTCFQKNASN